MCFSQGTPGAAGAPGARGAAGDAVGLDNIHSKGLIKEAGITFSSF